MPLDLTSLVEDGLLGPMQDPLGRLRLEFDRVWLDGADLVGEVTLAAGDRQADRRVVILHDAADAETSRVESALRGCRFARFVHWCHPAVELVDPQQLLAPRLLRLRRPRDVTAFTAAALRRFRWQSLPADEQPWDGEWFPGSWAWTGPVEGVVSEELLSGWLKQAMPFESMDRTASLQFVEVEPRDGEWTAVLRLIGWAVSGDKRRVMNIKEQPVHLGRLRDAPVERVRSYLLAWELAMFVHWAAVSGETIARTMPNDWTARSVLQTRAHAPLAQASAMLARSRLGRYR